MQTVNYALITAARNEEDYIEKTLQSVVSQTIQPLMWVIISDGSTDRTDEIVTRYAKKYDFIHFIRSDGDQNRNFGSKAKAFNHGYDLLKDLDFEFVGNLDADLSLPENYYETMINRFRADAKLGVAGGVRYDNYNGKFIPWSCAKNSVGGPFQFFRRECMEQIGGGYFPLPHGGIDAVAEISARMKGWRVRSFDDVIVYHHRCTGSATGSFWQNNLRNGIKLYAIGYDPLFHVVSSIGKTMERPLFSTFIAIAGYFWAGVKRIKRPVSNEFIHYLRNEQRQRLRAMVLGTQNG